MQTLDRHPRLIFDCFVNVSHVNLVFENQRTHGPVVHPSPAPRRQPGLQIIMDYVIDIAIYRDSPKENRSSYSGHLV